MTRARLVTGNWYLFSDGSILKILVGQETLLSSFVAKGYYAPSNIAMNNPHKMWVRQHESWKKISEEEAMNRISKITQEYTSTTGIKSKVIIFFKGNDEFVDMCIIDNTEQAELLSRTAYDFPCYYRIYDDIPRATEFKFKIDSKSKSIRTEFKSIDGEKKTSFSEFLTKGQFNEISKIIEEKF